MAQTNPGAESTDWGAPPYAEFFVDLLKSVAAALGDLLEFEAGGGLPAQIDHRVINRHFSWLCLLFDHGTNRHLFDGTYRLESLRTEGLRPDRKRQLSQDDAERLSQRRPLDPLNDLVQTGATRISRLILQEFLQAKEARNPLAQSDQKSVVVPSPLRVTISYLTDPDIPETRQYAYYTARHFLFQSLRCVPENFSAPRTFRRFSASSISDELSKIYTSTRERRDSRGFDPLAGAAHDRTGSLLRHLFAIEGFFLLRFKGYAKAIAYCRSDAPESSVAPFRSAPFEFERVRRLRKLPALGIVVNELLGTPIPLRGATTIFAGGLRLNSENGLVVAVQGGPGAGKTSMALALSASLAPLNFHSLFVTAEETSLDLRSKVEALRPSELHRISCIKDLSESLTYINVRDDGDDDSLSDVPIIDRVVDVLNDHFSAMDLADETLPSGSILTPTKSIIVLDGLHDMFASSGEKGAGDYEDLRSVIEACRQQRSLVILTTGIEWADSSGLEYLVDLSLTIDNIDDDDIDTKPRRQLIVSKSRHQLASIGAHGFQIGGDRGFRFSPQANYQLDHMTTLEPALVDTQGPKRLVFQYAYAASSSGKGLATRPITNPDANWLFPRASVFINGRGSGGKAGLALRIAMTPFEGFDGDRSFRHNKVLVISFLYGAQYYSNLFDTLKTRISAEFGNQDTGYFHPPEVMQLYPGSLRADELFNKVRGTIEAEIIRGEPFTDVIVDGMHNVFLQFPDLDRNMVFWPQLFALMRQYDVSLITTNTILVVEDRHSPYGFTDVDNGKSEPLRQALVSKTDFHIEVNRHVVGGDNFDESNFFAVSVRSAVGQRIVRKPVLWDRERLIFLSDVQGQLAF